MLMTSGELQFGLVHRDLFRLSKFPETCFPPKIIKNYVLKKTREIAMILFFKCDFSHNDLF